MPNVPVRFRCRLCSHSWVVDAPTDLWEFSKFMGRQECPQCGARPKDIVLGGKK